MARLPRTPTCKTQEPGKSEHLNITLENNFNCMIPVLTNTSRFFKLFFFAIQ